MSLVRASVRNVAPVRCVGWIDRKPTFEDVIVVRAVIAIPFVSIAKLENSSISLPFTDDIRSTKLKLPRKVRRTRPADILIAIVASTPPSAPFPSPPTHRPKKTSPPTVLAPHHVNLISPHAVTAHTFQLQTRRLSQ